MRCRVLNGWCLVRKMLDPPLVPNTLSKPAAGLHAWMYSNKVCTCQSAYSHEARACGHSQPRCHPNPARPRHFMQEDSGCNHERRVTGGSTTLSKESALRPQPSVSAVLASRTDHVQGHPKGSPATPATNTTCPRSVPSANPSLVYLLQRAILPAFTFVTSLQTACQAHPLALFLQLLLCL